MKKPTIKELQTYIEEYIVAADEAEDRPVHVVHKLMLTTLPISTDRLYDFMLYRTEDLHTQGVIHADDERDAIVLAIKLVFEALFGIK